MSIQFSHSQPVACSTQQAFAMIDDLSATSRWLPPCVSLTNARGTPNQVGDRLAYVFKQGGRQAQMDGEIVTRLDNKQLVCRYWDAAFEVLVDLRVDSHAQGCLTIHTITITPKTFIGKLFSPLIRMGLRKQTLEAAANLQRLLEA